MTVLELSNETNIHPPGATKADSPCPVSSHNEWDRLEEVIVGRLEGAAIPWTSINVLMLDEKRVVVDRSQVSLIRSLKVWGFEPMPIPFSSYLPFGGSFHCATLDIRRRGLLERHF
jgi:N-dimethylarginine dimethylaminohydrolase